VDFGVENVFNQKYDLPLGGVDIGTQPTSRYMRDGGWVYPDGAYPVGNVAGMGRSFYAGLTLKF
jgi:outer membrane receptor protein involved in Fe transport